MNKLLFLATFAGIYIETLRQLSQTVGRLTNERILTAFAFVVDAIAARPQRVPNAP